MPTGLFLIIFAIGVVWGDVYVSPVSNCSSLCVGTLDSPYSTILDALLSHPQDNIVLLPGTYTGPGNTALDISQGPQTNITSANGSSVTIIDCAGTFGFYLMGADRHISGLTIKNCRADSNRVGGGAIRAEGTQVFLQDVVLSNNHALDGGALWIQSGQVFLENVTITGSTAQRSGGGIYSKSAYVYAVDVRVTDNHYNSTDDLSGPGHDLYCESGTFLLDTPSYIRQHACISNCKIQQNNYDVCDKCNLNNGWCDSQVECTNQHDDTPATCGGCPAGFSGNGRTGCFLVGAQPLVVDMNNQLPGSVSLGVGQEQSAVIALESVSEIDTQSQHVYSACNNAEFRLINQSSSVDSGDTTLFQRFSCPTGAVVVVECIRFSVDRVITPFSKFRTSTYNENDPNQVEVSVSQNTLKCTFVVSQWNWSNPNSSLQLQLGAKFDGVPSVTSRKAATTMSYGRHRLESTFLLAGLRDGILTPLSLSTAEGTGTHIITAPHFDSFLVVDPTFALLVNHASTDTKETQPSGVPLGVQLGVSLSVIIVAIVAVSLYIVPRMLKARRERASIKLRLGSVSDALPPTVVSE
eukprot:TRINITY_DN2583_c0_g2_i3.p1 TRINITY_DN2583_c0_g2~~TRINITY_DN2583_c0_g2_i3.p1  ORF type:complete len:587 (-),score=1.65 TRINITY_DN2583_c0_g2_i3:24-1763(-)